MKKTIRLTESELVNLVKRVLSEQQRFRQGTMADIMALQDNILSIEFDKGIAKIIPDNPKGCKYDEYGYTQGEKNQCLISGTTLCQKPCFRKQAIDGILGSLTKAAYEKYKNEKPYSDDDQTLEDWFDSEYSTLEDWGVAHTENWQIPARMDNIKAFQYWVWKVKEKDAPANQNGYQSILCGGNFCQENKAIDGYWGVNTKKAWDKFGAEYLQGYDVFTTFDTIYTNFKDEQKKFRGTPYSNTQPTQPPRSGPFFK